MPDSPRALLIQIRDAHDNMRQNEVRCFVRSAQLEPEQLRVHDLLSEQVTPTVLRDTDLVFIGGSGRYSATDNGSWIEPALDSLRCVHDSGVPTFASCWGHQAMARAMGGAVLHAPTMAEVGTMRLTVTDGGREDPLFRHLGDEFDAHMGHEDSVVALPRGTTLLATSPRCRIEAYRFDDAPVYCTQFHPELQRSDLLLRLDAYPEYVESLAGVPAEEFGNHVREAPESNALLPRFVELLVGRGDC